MAGKVFLSHSSKDKALVRRVCDALGSLRCEMDEFTFEAGLPNWDIIVRAFDRCEVFALFATREAFESDWVRNEVAEARRRLRANSIRRLLIFSVNGMPLREIPSELREFAIYLSLSKPETIVQAIQRHLLELNAARRQPPAVFVGRDQEVGEVKEMLLSSPSRPVGLSISGLPGMGRSAIVKRVLQDLEPGLQAPPRAIDFHVFQSCADLALEILNSVQDLITLEEVDAIRARFLSDDASTCGTRLAEMLNQIHDERQFVIFSDYGGVINNAGAYTNIVETLLAAARKTNARFSINLLTRRRPVPKVRSAHADMVFLDVKPLTESQAAQYINSRARILNIALTPEQTETIINLGKGVPQNLDFVLDHCQQYPPAAIALANVEDFVTEQRERSRDLLADITLSADAAFLLSVVRSYFHVPAEFVAGIFSSYEAAADACIELLDKHVAVEAQGVYSVSPPLWDAIDRDPRFELKDDQALDVARAFVAALEAYQSDGVVPISIINAGSVAAIMAGEIKGNFASHFIMPSHYIYLARHCYDRRQWNKAMNHADAAIAYRSSLTNAAYIQACRTLGMSAARLGLDEVVVRACQALFSVKDSYAEGSARFVRGFAHRLNGKYDLAERELMQAKITLRDDQALQRELATVKLLAGDNDEALAYGEIALARAPASPFLLDIVARARIRRAMGREDIDADYELANVMERLQKVAGNGRFSFFALRSAELNLKAKRLSAALDFASQAVRQTSDLPAPYLLRARVHLASARESKASRDAASRDLEVARDKTRVQPGRHRHVDSEVQRVEFEAAFLERNWLTAIRTLRRLDQYGVKDFKALHTQLVDAIQRDRRTLHPEVEAFLEEG